jgi:hypothetical protein
MNSSLIELTIHKSVRRKQPFVLNTNNLSYQKCSSKPAAPNIYYVEIKWQSTLIILDRRFFRYRACIGNDG